MKRLEKKEIEKTRKRVPKDLHDLEHQELSGADSEDDGSLEKSDTDENANEVLVMGIWVETRLRRKNNQLSVALDRR